MAVRLGALAACTMVESGEATETEIATLSDEELASIGEQYLALDSHTRERFEKTPTNLDFFERFKAGYEMQRNELVKIIGQMTPDS